MKKVFLIALVALIAAPSAGATLRMYGDVKQRHWRWAARANTNMPIPDARFALYSGHDPQYLPGLREMYLPRPGHGGWTYWDERVLFLHELGHVYDFRHLSRAERNLFRATAGTPFAWWSKKTEVPPGEIFAEQYSACALGMTLRERDAIPSVSYGWEPPSNVGLCPLIRSFY